jgi:cardiolipin synthase (CMP-forming)
MPGDNDHHLSDELLTIPNMLSLLRIALVPVFLGFLLTEQDAIALVVLIAAALTDFLDGFLARHLNQVTRLGTLLDPIADRLSIVAAVLGLAFRGFLPWWLVIIVLARDVALLALGAVMSTHRIGPPAASLVGKAATFLLLIALPVFVCAGAFPATSSALIPIGVVVSVVGAVLYWAAGIGYARTVRRKIVERRNDTPRVSASLSRQRRSPDG